MSRLRGGMASSLSGQGVGGHAGFPPYSDRDVEAGSVAVGVGGEGATAGRPTSSPSVAYARPAQHGTAAYGRVAAGVAVVTLVLFLLAPEAYRYAAFVLGLCALGLTFCKFLSDWLLGKDDGTPEMRAVADPIREGAAAFLATQYTAIAQMAVVVAVIIFFSFFLRPQGMTTGISSLPATTLGFLAAFSFLLGATCSAAAGYVSMLIAAQTNIRVTSAARRGYMEALAICFRGGAFSAILVLAMCVMGVTVLHALLHLLYAAPAGALDLDGTSAGLGVSDIPLLTVGYGFGASFVALFMQLGGGVYTKGADVGADMVRACGGGAWGVGLGGSSTLHSRGASAVQVGKIEQGIPEDDPRNPAVIADLVGEAARADSHPPRPPHPPTPAA
jgi:H+-translocating diphosphatase